MQWYYADANKEQIAFEEEEFEQLIHGGKILRTTLVWNESMADWQPASNVKPAAFIEASSPGATNAQSPYVVSPAGVAPTPAPAANPTDGLSIAALICGIFAVLMTCGYGIGLFPGIAAVICGHKSKKKIAENPGLGGDGLATAGLITGYVGIALSVLVGGFMIFAIVMAIVSEGALE